MERETLRKGEKGEKEAKTVKREDPVSYKGKVLNACVVSVSSVDGSSDENQQFRLQVQVYVRTSG